MPTDASLAAGGADGGVTVCICTRRRPDDLARTLASLARSTYPIAQVVVSDDGHDEATAAVCRGAAVAVDYVRGPQRGLGANRNRALDEARGSRVLFLDDDCLLAPTFLAAATACMAEAERRVGTATVVVTGDELNGGRIVSAHDQTFLGFQARPYASEAGWRSIVINATLFPARLFSALRFDPQLRYGYEEVDLASRAAAAGYVIVHCPAACNDHRPSPLGRDDYDLQREASRLYVTLRRRVMTDRRPLLAAAFAVVAPLHLLAAAVKRQGIAGVPVAGATVAAALRMLARSRPARWSPP